MNKLNQNNLNPKRLLKTIGGSLLVIPTMLITSIAVALPVKPDNTHNQVPSKNPGTPNAPLNSKPGISNQPPHNRTQGKTPTNLNAAPTPNTQPLPSKPPLQPVPATEVQPPLPEERQSPSAIVTPVDGKLNIKLINATKAVITYQVIGDTDQRTLAGDSNATLRNLKMPVTLTFDRKDRGLLQVNTQATQGFLEVTLDETTNLEEDKETVRIEADGKVFIN